MTKKLDLELLRAAALNKPRSYLYSHPKQEFNAIQQKKFDAMLSRYNQGEPIAYILGKKEFWSLDFFVDHNVLIPRPETELLLEITLEHFSSNSSLKVADLGTGCGAIAIALASEKPNWQITALDNSPEALKIAQQNAKNHNATNINFIHSNWLKNISQNTTFDLIISNPPYIDQNDPHLHPSTKFEPQHALISAENGLLDLKKIINSAKQHLKPNGMLLLEHGFQQGEAVRKILQSNNYQQIRTYRDLANLERATSALTPCQTSHNIF
ncbi:MAG: peptide chain release factor N(5)-glutamine methyltransferase [Gammaproteobacteria bacterium]|nr:peptide chain release factor N(5)-glutamine methyltransferase [Gammaproteobacteria bacterium]